VDTANIDMPYDCAINLVDLITVDDVCDNLHLGPNGSLMYSIEYIESNLDWLIERIDTLLKKHADRSLPPAYILFDCPGQIELYTHHGSMHRIIDQLVRRAHLRLCCVNLIDSYYCSNSSNFISVLLTSLSTMLHLELPHVNILSKIDLIERYGSLDFNIDFYTDVLDLSYLMTNKNFNKDRFQPKLAKKYRRFNRLLCDVIQDYSLVSYIPLNVQDRSNIERVVRTIDKANGFIFGQVNDDDLSIRTNLMSNAYGVEQFEYTKTANIREKYMLPDDEQRH
jgi:GPN-loop GTPase